MKITVLVENTTKKENILSEHGLSLYIETENHNLLFDMGQSNIFESNAKELGIDLTGVDIAVLSHGHYDHGGGLKRFLQINEKANVYISKYAFEPHYNGTEKYIGLDVSLEDSDRLVYTDDMCRIADGLTLYSCNDKKKNHDLGSFGLTLKENREFIPDDFRHEQYLRIEEKGKSVLVSGCSHKGIMDIADWFHPDVIIGGFHYSKLEADSKLESYARYLDSFDTRFYTCHCTGVEQFDFMQHFMTDLVYISGGDIFEI